MNTTVRWQESYPNDLLAEKVVFNTLKVQCMPPSDGNDKEDFFPERLVSPY